MWTCQDVRRARGLQVLPRGWPNLKQGVLQGGCVDAEECKPCYPESWCGGKEDDDNGVARWQRDVFSAASGTACVHFKLH